MRMVVSKRVHGKCLKPPERNSLDNMKGSVLHHAPLTQPHTQPGLKKGPPVRIRKIDKKNRGWPGHFMALYVTLSCTLSLLLSPEIFSPRNFFCSFCLLFWIFSCRFCAVLLYFPFFGFYLSSKLEQVCRYQNLSPILDTERAPRPTTIPSRPAYEWDR